MCTCRQLQIATPPDALLPVIVQFHEDTLYVAWSSALRVDSHAHDCSMACLLQSSHETQNCVIHIHLIESTSVSRLHGINLGRCTF